MTSNPENLASACEAAWLVECPKYHPGEYFARCECGCGRHHWTPDVHRATKFPTKEAAETARGGDTNCIAYEHQFGLTLPRTAAPPTEGVERLRHELAMIGADYASKGLEREAATITEAIERIATLQAPGASGEVPLSERKGVRRVVHELRLSMQVFRDYGYQHQDKADEANDPKEKAERERKAKRNFERAAACEAALDDFDAAPTPTPSSEVEKVANPWRRIADGQPTVERFLAAYFYTERGEWIYDFATWHRDHVCGDNDGSGPWTHWAPLTPPAALPEQPEGTSK